MIKTLQAGVAKATFEVDHGGRLSSLCVGDLELLVTSGAETIAYGCYPMAPWAGRIREGRFCWAGREHQLPINLPPHAIHGTVFERPWRRQGEQLHVDLGASWPWPGRVCSVLQLLPDGLSWSLEVHAERDPMPVVLGWHPWFRRQLARGGPLEVTFNAAGMMRRDASGITTTEVIDVPEGPWDDCFVGVQRPVKLRWPGAVTLTIDSDCSHWVVYDEPDHAVCVEPQSGPPDAVNLGLAAEVVPGRPFIRTMTLRWVLED